MEMEHKRDLRCVYARNLVLLIERWGLHYYGSHLNISCFNNWFLLYAALANNCRQTDCYWVSSPKYENYIIIYSPSCCSKPI